MDFFSIMSDLAQSAAKLASPKAPSVGHLRRGWTQARVGTSPAPSFVALATGSLGGFPYFWQDPATMLFNADTYYWINSAVNAGSEPNRLGDRFTNRANAVLSALRYTYTPAQIAQLQNCNRQLVMAQFGLLQGWQSVFGPTWSNAAGSPIDFVLQTIAADWASPAISVETLMAAPDPAVLLANAPAQAGSILPLLGAYCLASSANNQIVNLPPRQTGLLASACAALQNPTAANGGLMLNNGQIVPAFQVTTPVQTIVAGLCAGSASLDKSFVVQPARAGQDSVSMGAGSSAVGDLSQFLSITSGSGTELAGAALAQAGQPVSVDASFAGITQVAFQPVPFDPATESGWLWIDPIREAAQNVQAGGFSFSPKPPYDLSSKGQFCWLTGLLIARTPTLTITLPGTAAQSIAQTITSDPSASVSLLGQDLTEPGEASTLVATLETTPGSQPNAVRIAQSSANPSLSSRAYVLGGIVSSISD